MDCKQECAKKYICKNHPNICGICISLSCVTNNYPCFLEKDLVEVVRCKDCRYWQDNNGGYPHEECRWGKEETPDEDDFCSYGERKDS